MQTAEKKQFIIHTGFKAPHYGINDSDNCYYIEKRRKVFFIFIILLLKSSEY